MSSSSWSGTKLLFLLLLCFSFSRLVKGQSKYDWKGAMARVYQVLDQSIEFDAERINKAEDPAPSLLINHLNVSGGIWIVNGKLYAQESFLNEMKNRLHLRFMWSILSGRNWQLSRPVAEYLEQLKKKKIGYSFSSGSVGELSPEYPPIPTFVIAKKYPHPRGILFPNPYFSDLSSWKVEMSNLLKIAEQKDWKARTHRVFWRGKLNWLSNMTRCEYLSGRFARLSAATMSVTHPKLFDVKVTDCPQKWDRTLCSNIYNYTHSEIEALSDCTPIHGKSVPHKNFSDFSMVLDLPGSTRGSYSRNLNHLWLMGGVVLIWTGPMIGKDGAEQWYSPALTDKHTHRVIDRKTAQLVVFQILNNPEERKYLVENARSVAQRLLCADCLVEYALTALMRMEQRIPALSTLLNNPNKSQAVKMRKILKEVCQKQKWVRVDGLHKNLKRVNTSDGQELCKKLVPSLHMTNRNWGSLFSAVTSSF